MLRTAYKTTGSKYSAQLVATTFVKSKFDEAIALHRRGDVDRAQIIYEEILIDKPEHFDALHLLGVIASQKGEYARGVALISQSVAINSKNYLSHFNLGFAKYNLNEFNSAIESYDRAIELKPDYSKAHSNKGGALKQLNRLNDAIASYELAIQYDSNSVADYANLATLLIERNEVHIALDVCDKGITIDPFFSELYFVKGNALQRIKSLTEAAQLYKEATRINPHYFEAYINLAVTLSSLNLLEQAVEEYLNALRIKNKSFDAIAGIADAYSAMDKFHLALEYYQLAICINWNAPYLQGLLSFALLKTCTWDSYYSASKEILEKVKAGRKAILSFPLLALTDSLEIQRKASEIWAQDKYPFDNSLGPLVKRDKRDRIRIGYYSADFHSHATANLMAGLFEGHDRSKFELFAFSFGPDKQDSMRQRLTQAFDQFIDVRSNSDKEVAEFSRMLGIDIAVDLKGSTKDHRFGIFSYRAAPVQISYIGYPGTMGADYIDYLIADKTVVPEAHQKHYAEKIIYLPDSYQVNDRKRVIADKTYTREELGLPIEGFVFCCFNNNYKITPAVFDGWMRILKAVPRSVLWLFEDNHMAAINLRKEAAARGIDEDRLVFAKPMPLDHHLARHSAADLFLDTTPVNAHTTASDALWAGLPLLTCIGESFASRVAASLLQAVGMPEFIANTQEEYEEKAIGLAQNPAQLKALRQKLQFNRLNAPLFNTEKITSHIEKAYANVYERYHADLMPENIYVENSI